jgi:hypothetical protein
MIAKIAAARVTGQVQTCADDRTSEATMEGRKREGCF